MKFKFDKDTLLKQRFWVLLAIALPCALLGLLTLVTTVAADIAADRKKVDDKLKQISSTAMTGMVNAKTIEVKKGEADVLKKKEDEVWEAAWLPQAPIMKWPAEIENRFQF